MFISASIDCAAFFLDRAIDDRCLSPWHDKPHSSKQSCLLSSPGTLQQLLFNNQEYRLCPADEPLTEACFQKHPLGFNPSGHQLQFNNGTRKNIAGTFVGPSKLSLPLLCSVCAYIGLSHASSCSLRSLLFKTNGATLVQVERVRQVQFGR